MLKKPRIIGAVVILFTMCGYDYTAANESTLKRLKTLSGSWAVLDSEGVPTVLHATYQVVAGGSATIETLLAGTPEETVTIYHFEGKHVTVTKLSGRGAPVRLVPRITKDKDALRFESAAEKVSHGRLSGLRLTWIDQDHMRLEWFLQSDNDSIDSRTFELRREASIEKLASEVARLRVDLDSLQRELDLRLKRVITVKQKGKPTRVLLETRTFPLDPGWNNSGVPMRQFLHDQTIPFATTYSSKGDKGMTVAHYGFKAGPDCRLKFSVLGGHGYIAIVEEKKAPPRRITSVPDFSVKLDEGIYGPTIERIVGGHWTDIPRAVDWDLARFEGKPLRLYIVDAETNHFGQIAISEVSILERGPIQ